MNPKFKAENYNQMGGLNTKVSPYLLSPLEFLELDNFDFQTPGSLTQRWGSTQYIGHTLGIKTTALAEYTKLDGSSYLMFGSTGALYFGATTGNHQGISLSVIGLTNVLKGRFSYYSYIAGSLNEPANAGWFYQGQDTAQFIAGKLIGNTFSIASGVHGSGRTDVSIINNWAFICDGSKFIKFDGTNEYLVSLPPATISATGPIGNVS